MNPTKTKETAPGLAPWLMGEDCGIEGSPTWHFPDRLCEPGYYGAVLLGSPDRKGCHPLCKNRRKEESLLVSLVFTGASVTSNLGCLVSLSNRAPIPWSQRLSLCVRACVRAWCGKRFQRQDGQVPSGNDGLKTEKLSSPQESCIPGKGTEATVTREGGMKNSLCTGCAPPPLKPETGFLSVALAILELYL